MDIKDNPADLPLFYPARIASNALESRDHDALIALAQEVAIEPLEAETPPYFIRAEISSNRLDSYYTRMDPKTTLPNFAKTAGIGVSLLDSHVGRRLGIGYSLTGELEASEITRVLVDFYTVPGLRFGGTHSFESTDDYIKALNAGLIRDVSVGFWGGQTICSVCDLDMWSWGTRCPHFPGVEYEGDGENEMVMAEGLNVDYDLSEASLVYDGATPGAMVIKAERMGGDGTLAGAIIEQLETRYRMAVRRPAGSHKPKPSKGYSNMELTQQDIDDIETALNASPHAPMKGSMPEQVSGLIKTAAKLSDDLEAAESTITELTPRAKEGEQYRTDLIEAALTEGTRAVGDQFNLDMYRAAMETATTETIKQMAADWKTAGDSRFTPGRKTKDEGDRGGKSSEIENPELHKA